MVILGAIVLLRRRWWGVVLGGLVLGLMAGARQSLPPAPPSPSSEEFAAAWVVDERWSERSVRAWIRGEEGGSHPVQLSGLPEDLRSGARGYAFLRWRAPQGGRNPDDADDRRRSRARRIVARAWLVGEPLVLGRGRSPNGEVGRDALARRWERSLPPATHGLWRALLLADRSGLDPAATERLRRLGLAHLLALSGLHVGIVVGVLLLPLRRWGWRAQFLVLPLLLLWVAVAGAGPSLMRAVAMLTWLASARRLGRPADPLLGLAVVATLDLAWRPAELLGVGWWLSYAATAAILRVLPGLKRTPRILAGLGVSLAAQTATAPWILGSFGAIAPAAAVVLLVLGPLFALLLAAGVVILGSATVLPMLPGSGPLLTLGGHLFGAAAALLEKIVPAPWGHPGIAGLGWAAALTALGLVLPPWRAGVGGRWILASALVIGAHAGLLRAPAVRWISLDVGQGDAGVLRAGDDALVVDAGPRTERWDAGERVVLPYLQRRNLREVGLALTHGHEDHVGGAAALLETGRIGRVYLARCDSQRAWAVRLGEMARAAQVEVMWIAAGDRVRHGALLLHCLWPPASSELEDANDRSLVLRFEDGGRALLLTGDLEREAETRLLARSELEPVAVLKVAHHGGDTGTGGPWLDRLRPRWAVLSCGIANRYGHPDPELVERLRRRGIQILRTDRHGAIEIMWSSVDGQRPRVRTVGSGFLDDPEGRSYPPAVRSSRASRDRLRGPGPVRVSEQSGR